MSADVRLVVVLGALHVMGFGLGAGLLLLALRTGERPTPSDGPDGGGGGGSSSLPPPPPLGPPLPDARPARVRLRDHTRPGGRPAPAPRRRSPGEPSRIPAPP